MQGLDHRAVVVWWVATGDFGRAGEPPHLRALLSADEQAHLEPLQRADDRDAYVVGHALVRTALSAVAGVGPRQWTFATNAHGRPEIASPREFGMLRFNLSHTRDFVACAVARNRDVGVDVEDLRRLCPLAMRGRYFAPTEVAALDALPEGAQPTRFFEYWTLKESYVKARGEGLSLALDRFAFDLKDHESITARFDPCLEDDPRCWQHMLRRPTPHHVLAVSVRRWPWEQVTLVMREARAHLLAERAPTVGA